MMLGGDVVNSLLSQPSRSMPRPGKSNFDKGYDYMPAHYDEEEDVLVKIKQSIKDYQDENLTGLTDEERKKIDDEVKAYLESLWKKRPNGVLTDEDIASVRDLIQSLLKKYGAKAEGEEMVIAAYLGKNKNAQEYKMKNGIISRA
jgi:alpha-L-fucosidase